MQQLKMCDLLTALNALDPFGPFNVGRVAIKTKRNQVLQPLADVINDPENLFFLASQVNQAKATYVVAAIKSEVIKSSENQFFAAMESYLRTTKVTTASRAVAVKLNAAIQTIAKNAAALEEALPNPPPADARAKGIEQPQNLLIAAVAAQKAEAAKKVTFIDIWNRVLLGKVVNE
ncbi:hypothetical protein SISNIDRAFT_282446 [Sistotremastrum niveocremeum HHB9708]|uniref:Uncharacterized protein n=1 Tax=Sistotremastrum niveocremeum HHB9708 TaxID=1314777 RepID=A0A164Y7X7_9AGAM|nr:hypothetical protein SISNIDRAFT_282446 [Sistotremastrum niveocremeum HHB9708]